MTVREQRIYAGMAAHWEKAVELYGEDRIVGLFLQGSQNYGLDDEESDIDTKLLVIPTLEEVIFNKQPISTTHILENDEHMDAKDIRLYFQCFRKGNPNFLEIMFTDFYMLNPEYADLWEDVVEMREDIAHLNPLVAAKAMMGMVQEKFHAMEHKYPSRARIIDEFGYDPKQLSHLIRVSNMLQYYVMNPEVSYKELLDFSNFTSFVRENYQTYLKDVKRGGAYSLEEARVKATEFLGFADGTLQVAKERWNGKEDELTVAAMQEVQAEFVRRYLRKELM